MELLILLLIGYGAGYCHRNRSAKLQIDARVREISELLHQLNVLEYAEAQRLHREEGRKQFAEENDVRDPENQKRFIENVTLRAVRPVNKEAVGIMYAIEDWIYEYKRGWRVGFEVSMGAFIKTPYDPENEAQRKSHDKAFSSYNSKRVDFLLIDRKGQPKLAVEYNGTGHDLSDDADDRMEVKRLALERAGIPCIEIEAHTSGEEVMRMLTKILLPRPKAPKTKTTAPQPLPTQVSDPPGLPESLASFIYRDRDGGG
ncbi:DUF2726 domain-containing protein [Aliihoeflea sp. 40Bstr573]|uniref:DUF2726 domain-containing protein n=1 Tax=Aliihoeflea sp. 40Bstr573 TaxID=2696467 RepID=UPI00209501B6|nr:DUF2726 domain-containing protein [Aliihoeflea sp. 40Bstr573]MCO6388259.1 DUF2726 domain-containing protein [Aliihoeflea sp. 40Bstr573]